MLNFEFSYKGYKIIVSDSVDSCPFLVKCVSDNMSFCLIQECITRPEAFRFIYKFLSFVDNME